MKEYIAGAVSAFAVMAAYKMIQNKNANKHDNCETLSTERNDEFIRTTVPATLYESSDKDGFYYGYNTVSGNEIWYDRKNSHLPNGLILGSAGSGKTWAAIDEIIQVIDKTNDDIIIFDKEGYFVYSEQVKGNLTSVSPYDRNSEYHINPLDVYITAYDDTNISEKITITDTIDKTFCLMEGIICRNLTNAEKSVIADKVKELFIPFVKYLIDNRLQYDYEHNPTLSDIAELLLSEKDTELTVNLHEQEVVIKEYFSYKTHMPDDRAVVLSWEDTPHFLNSALYAGGVMYSWNRLLQNREKRKYTWIYLEEMDSLLSNKTESTLSIVYELFKRSRPYGGIVTLIAQSVEERKKSEIGNACLVSAGFIRCLSCKCQDRNSISKVFGLHDDILEYINSAPAGTGLLIAPEHVIPFDIKQQV